MDQPSQSTGDPVTEIIPVPQTPSPSPKDTKFTRESGTAAALLWNKHRAERLAEGKEAKHGRPGNWTRLCPLEKRIALLTKIAYDEKEKTADRILAVRAISDLLGDKQKPDNSENPATNIRFEPKTKIDGKALDITPEPTSACKETPEKKPESQNDASRFTLTPPSVSLTSETPNETLNETLNETPSHVPAALPPLPIVPLPAPAMPQAVTRSPCTQVRAQGIAPNEAVTRSPGALGTGSGTSPSTTPRGLSIPLTFEDKPSDDLSSDQVTKEIF